MAGCSQHSVEYYPSEAASVLGARHLAPYFGVRRGLSVYRLVSDQEPQFNLAAINCQLREGTFALDGVLHQDVCRIEEHYTDTHGQSDLIFGLFELLAFARPAPAGPSGRDAVPAPA